MTDEVHGEFDAKLSRYREQLGNVMHEENQRFSKLAQEHAQQIVHEAWQEAEEIIAGSQRKAGEIVDNGKREAADIVSHGQRNAEDIVLAARTKAEEITGEGREKANALIEEAKRLSGEVGARIEQEAREQAETLLADARQEAADLVKRAEDDLNRQLREKTREQREKILAEAHEEADVIVAAATAAAEEAGQRVVRDLREETRQKLERETANFQTYARARADEVRHETEQQAASLLKAIDGDSRHFNDQLVSSIRKYEDILARLKDEVQNEVAEMAKQVTAARRDIEKKLTSYETETGSEPAASAAKPSAGASLWITLGEPMDGADFDLYKGRLDLKTLSVADHSKVRSLKTFLTRVQNVEFVGESSNEEGTVLSFEVTKPMPLMEILDNVPDVITSEQSGNNIKLTLN